MHRLEISSGISPQPSEETGVATRVLSVCLLFLLSPWDFLGRNTGAGCHFLLQGIFPTQGLNLETCVSCMSLHWRVDYLPLHHPECLVATGRGCLTWILGKNCGCHPVCQWWEAHGLKEACHHSHCPQVPWTEEALCGKHTQEDPAYGPTVAAQA